MRRPSGVATTSVGKALTEYRPSSSSIAGGFFPSSRLRSTTRESRYELFTRDSIWGSPKPSVSSTWQVGQQAAVKSESMGLPPTFSCVDLAFNERATTEIYSLSLHDALH